MKTKEDQEKLLKEQRQLIQEQLRQYREPMRSVATPFRTFQSPVNSNANRMITRSMAQTMPQTTPVRNILASHFTSRPPETPLQVHERRQAFVFRNQPNFSSSSSISTIPATSSSTGTDTSLFGGLGNVRHPPNKFMRFVHERITPRWQRFEPRAIQFFKRQKHKIGRIGPRLQQFEPRAVQFLKRHKRKIGIGLGVLAGTAIVGGTVGGILKKTPDSSEPSSLNQMPVGHTIYSGGGGGGGGSLSPYAGMIGQNYVARTHKQKRKSTKNIRRRKRKSIKNYLKLKSTKKFKRKPKRRVKKRKTSRKKSKSRKFPAF